jgi:YgiT-type zinc finger domain-containing protein
MKCPNCGAPDFVHDTRDLPFNHGSVKTSIRAVTGDFCLACGEVVLDPTESARVCASMLELQAQIDSLLSKRQRRVSYDIRAYSFEQFVDFMFDRETPSGEMSFTSLAARGETSKWNPWHWRTDVTCDPRRICSYYLQMFRDCRFLLDRFSRDQLEQGFWAIQASQLYCSAYQIIWNNDLPFATREECVLAMFDLFKDLFFDEGLENSVCMWWDSFCYSWHCGNRKRSNGGEDMQMQDVMFKTLVKILDLDSKICQGAAIHGLSHLHHPKTHTAIQSFLGRNPDLDEQWRNVALAASRFELM